MGSRSRKRVKDGGSGVEEEHEEEDRTGRVGKQTRKCVWRQKSGPPSKKRQRKPPSSEAFHIKCQEEPSSRGGGEGQRNYMAPSVGSSGHSGTETATKWDGEPCLTGSASRLRGRISDDGKLSKKTRSYKGTSVKYRQSYEHVGKLSREGCTREPSELCAEGTRKNGSGGASLCSSKLEGKLSKGRCLNCERKSYQKDGEL